MNNMEIKTQLPHFFGYIRDSPVLLPGSETETTDKIPSTRGERNKTIECDERHFIYSGVANQLILVGKMTFRSMKFVGRCLKILDEITSKVVLSLTGRWKVWGKRRKETILKALQIFKKSIIDYLFSLKLKQKFS